MRFASLLLAFVLVAAPCQASGPGHGGGGGGHAASAGPHSSTTVHVGGYTRSNGTYVHGYDRAAPGTAEHGTAAPHVTSSSAGTLSGGAEGIHWSRDAAPSKAATAPAAPKKSASSTTAHHPSSHCSALAVRDKNDRIARSVKARHDFENAHPCPATGRTDGPCPGWVIDHVIALKRGGPDLPSNMQWQSVEDAKAKDKWE